MERHELEQFLDRQYMTVVVLNAAFMMSVCVFIGVAYSITESNSLATSSGAGNNIELIQILALFGVMELTFARTISKLLSNAVSNPRSSEPNQKSRIQQLFISELIRLALLESAAIFGLVASILSKDIIYAAGLGLAALLLIIFSWPRKHIWKETALLSTQQL